MISFWENKCYTVKGMEVVENEIIHDEARRNGLEQETFVAGKN